MKRNLLISFIMVLTLLFITSGIGMTAEYDLEGQTVEIVHWWSDSEDYEGEALSRLQEVEEMFNCNIVVESIHWSEAEEAYSSSILAGDPIGDVLYMENQFMEPLAIEGFLYPLSEVLDEEYYDSLPPTHQNMDELYGSFKNESYVFSANGFSFYPNINSDVSVSGIIWNKTLFEEEDLPNLYELQDKGEWDWDKMLEIAQKVTKDTDGDGNVDQWGIATWGPNLWNWRHNTSRFVLSNGADYVKKVENEYKVALEEEPILNALGYVNDLIEDYEVAAPEGEGIQLLGNGEVAMLDVHNLREIDNEALQDTEYEYGIAYTPKGPNTEKYFTMSNTGMYALPVNIDKDPRAVIEVVNALFRLTDDYRDMDNYVEDIIVKDYGEIVYDRESLDLLMEILPKWRPDIARQWGFVLNEVDFNAAQGAAVWGEQSPAEAMGEIAPAVQELLDERLN